MNPELRRNFWLELTLHRLLALPAVFVLLFLLIRALAAEDASRPISLTAVVIFAGLTAIWGSIQVAESVLGELRGRTWDGQRLSALDPWTMTWGKLAGAPAFGWYGGAICLVVYLAFSPEPARLAYAGLMLSSALLLHALALIGGIMAVRRGLVRSSANGWVLGLLFVIVGPWMSVVFAGDADIVWWGRGRERIDFLLAASSVFAAWGVFGAHRLMCQELRVRTTPWVWAVFLLFIAAYIAGFGVRARDTFGQQANVFLIAGLIVTLAAVYPLLFTEASGAMVVRRVLLRIAARDWRRALQEIPLWPVTLALGCVFCTLTALFVGPRGGENAMFGTLLLPPLPLFLLVVRDAALCMFFALARQPRRAETATIFYLLLAYWLLPMLLRVSEAPWAADLILPPFWERPGFAAVVAAVQAAAMIAAVLWRWRKLHN